LGKVGAATGAMVLLEQMPKGREWTDQISG
jgi:hypothetical protein